MLRLYLTLIGARVRAQMQYKVSFWTELVGFGLVTGLEFVSVAILFSRFGSIGGWGIAEVALLYGLTSLSFGLAEMVARGFDSPFERMMQQGAFDTVLTRPLGSFFSILASDFQLLRLGRISQALLVLGYALAVLPIGWTPARLLIVPLAVLSGASVDEFARLIQTGDVTALTRIPGIGKKTAERMVVELRDRAADFVTGSATASLGIGAAAQSEATSALQQLGYKPVEAARMARDATAAGDDAATIIRKALQSALR